MASQAAPAPRLPRARPSWRAAARFTLPAVILATLLFELALAERKYALFGGGFGQSRTLDAPLEIGAFLVALLACQSLVFWLLYRGLRRLHGRRGGGPLFLLNFALLIGGGAIGATIAKYEALSYFSDAMSLQIVRNLGGGSLTDALLFSLSEVGLALIVVAGAALVYAALLLFMRRRGRDAAALPDPYRLSARQIAALFVLVPASLFAANEVADARSALARFNSVTLVGGAMAQATDFDRDGWSLFSFPLDRQPFDGSRHPYALDIPNNGVDEDGLGGDLILTETEAPTITPVIAPERRRNVILIVLESTRADAIGMRVDGRPVAPTLEAMARSGSVAPAAYSHVGFTTQSLQSLFSGQLAPPEDRTSLVRDFLANGYQVGVFSGQAEDFGDTANRTGMRRGAIFIDATTNREERAFDFAAQGSLTIDGRVLLREFDARLGRREAWTQPHFLYFNLQSAHFPYSYPGMPQILPGEPIARGEISAANRERVMRSYWNAVAYNDRLIAALIERLRRLGVLGNTLIVVTADHGESLFDDGFLGHGHALNDQQTRIPFVISDAGVPIPAAIGLSDMRAIILGALGATVPARHGPVFQYLGTLDQPGSIGIVAGSERRLFNLFDETAWSSRSALWTPYQGLRGEDRRQADALIREWARQRWLSRRQGDGEGG